ncbi:MAG: hypothetical protein HQ474_01020 [Flammeovirgaceae bacterium]|nr:hypothetical protein [Flammeovirgaceae bacterium]
MAPETLSLYRKEEPEANQRGWHNAEYNFHRTLPILSIEVHRVNQSHLPIPDLQSKHAPVAIVWLA